MAYSKKTQRAISKYGWASCQKAYQMNREGYGASGISLEGPLSLRTTRQADAAIDAGREMAESLRAAQGFDVAAERKAEQDRVGKGAAL